MQADFWHERWEQNQIGFHQDEINNYLQEYWSTLSIPANAPVFVPLCGKSRDMLWLRAQGHPVIGVELSPLAVRGFFAENHLTPTVTPQAEFTRWETDGLVILCGDFFKLEAADVATCAGIFDRASLIALPPDMRAQYAEHFIKILPAHAETLLVTLEYNQSEMNGPPFSVSDAEVQALYAQAFQIERLCKLDTLPDNPGFLKRGVTRLDEAVFRLRPR